jgi:hypothetical protein
LYPKIRSIHSWRCSLTYSLSKASLFFWTKISADPCKQPIYQPVMFISRHVISSEISDSVDLKVYCSCHMCGMLTMLSDLGKNKKFMRTGVGSELIKHIHEDPPWPKLVE